ncbi:MAG: hypothetical protein FJZ58_07795 [Chlamydiae bacterium]|nr:hypothetical protein [Chlamydiota bacterium]
MKKLIAVTTILSSVFTFSALNAEETETPAAVLLQDESSATEDSEEQTLTLVNEEGTEEQALPVAKVCCGDCSGKDK